MDECHLFVEDNGKIVETTKKTNDLIKQQEEIRNAGKFSNQVC